ncbi:MAG: nitrogen regulation protein NR(II), partial [Candidatus Xenobia bacterium]
MVIGGSLEAWLQAMMQFPTPLWATDRDGRLMLWNDALSRLLGRVGEPGEAPGPRLRLRESLVLSERQNPLLEGELPASWVDAGLALEGADDLIPVDVWAMPLETEAGKPVGALAVVQETSREALYHKAVVGFQRTVGHDIRNAVSVLEGYLPLLLSSCGKPEQARPIIETLGRASQLLQGITTLMMNNARLTETLHPPQPERLLLRELVLEATRTLAPAAYN